MPLTIIEYICLFLIYFTLSFSATTFAFIFLAGFLLMLGILI